MPTTEQSLRCQVAAATLPLNDLGMPAHADPSHFSDVKKCRALARKLGKHCGLPIRAHGQAPKARFKPE